MTSQPSFSGTSSARENSAATGSNQYQETQTVGQYSSENIAQINQLFKQPTKEQME